MNTKFEKVFDEIAAFDALPPLLSDFAPVNRIKVYCRIGKGKATPKYNIHEYHVFYFCTGGSCQIEIEGVTYLLKANSSVGVPPYSRHRRLPNDNEKVLLFRFFPEKREVLQQVLGKVICYPKRFNRMLLSICDEYIKANRSGSQMLCNSVALQLSMLLNELKKYSTQDEVVVGSCQNRVQQILHELSNSDNFDKNLQYYADKYDLTPNYLSSALHKQCGYPPHKIRENVRWQKAANLLLHSKMTVSQIAENVGFKSVYSFSRFFKNVRGDSPQNFRCKNQNKLMTKCPYCGQNLDHAVLPAAGEL